MKFDKYSVKGRLFPAILSIILPIFIFNHFYASEEFSSFVINTLDVKVISNLSISLISNLSISFVALYFLSEVGRMLGKNVFEKFYFKEERNMPTTNFLLFSDSQYSKSHKLKIREKIKKDFSIILPTEEEEEKDINDSRVRIVETMALIRKKLHENKFLFQHNVEYGAMRNGIGGAIIGMIFSIFNVLFFYFINPLELAFIISTLTFFIYFLLLLFSRVMINFYGKNYAKILYREYLLE